ncbi:MAG: sigma-70 family RNA polymerase sigma factor [bacterium]
MQVPDEKLITQALTGDQTAYRELLIRHQKAIFQIILRIVRNRDETEDLVQETFMRAFNSLATYRSEYRFSTWLYRIAANCAIDFLRKKKIEALSLDKPVQTKDGAVGMEIPDRAQNPEERLWAKQRRNTIEEAIESLPAKYREVILYRHRDDQSYEDIARILNLPVGTVKARIFRARELLKKKLKSIR